MKSIYLLIIAITLTMTTACQTSPLPEEKIYTFLEQAVKLEEEFENQQNIMLDLESKEKVLYDQIINLGLKEIETIQQLSSEALTIVEERKKGLNKEYESMQKSKAEFEKAIDVVSQLEPSDLKLRAEQLVELMSKRYSTYEELYKSYSTSIDLDHELYGMFQNEELTLEQLEEQIQKINNSYEKVISLNETFNKVTEDFNEQKRLFYEASGFELTTKEVDKK